MIITYLGGEFIKVQLGDTVLACNPPSKASSLRSARFGADIALVTLNHEDFNGAAELSHGEKRPFVISGPGEYEIRDIFIEGFPASSGYGGAERRNTIYTVSLEGLKLLFLGALGNAEFESSVHEALAGIDILFVPIGGNGVLSPAAAYKLAVSLEPHLVIPIHFGGMGEQGSLDAFLREAGEQKKETLDKLVIKKKDVEAKEGDIVVVGPPV